MVEIEENKKAIIISSIAGIGAGVLGAFLYNKMHDNLDVEKKNLYINLNDVYTNLKNNIKNNIKKDVKKNVKKIDEEQCEEHYEMESTPQPAKKAKLNKK
jgi:hypothetical protein